MSFLTKQTANLPWDWYTLSGNHNITMAIVDANPDFPWDYDALSSNPNITIEMVLERLERPWNWITLSGNPNLRLEHILAYPEGRPEGSIKQLAAHSSSWSGYRLSCNPSFAIAMIETSTLNLHWSWGDLAKHPNIMPEYILQHGLPWVWEALSKNPNVTIKFVLDHPAIPWNWSDLSCNPGITMEMIEQNLDCPWVWESVSENPNLTLDMILNMSLKPWNWRRVSANWAITQEMVDDDTTPWDTAGLCANPNITIEKLTESTNSSFGLLHWSEMSINPMVDIDFLKETSQHAWNWFEVSKVIGGNIAFAKHQRKHGRPWPQPFADNATSKTFLGLPLDKPLDWYPAVLFHLTFVDNTVSDGFFWIVCQLPPELREKICAMVYSQTRISVKTLRLVAD